MHPLLRRRFVPGGCGVHDFEPGPPEQRSPLRQRIVETYSFPIAHGFRRTIDAATGIKNPFFTYTSLLRFSTLVFLNQFLRSPIQNSKVARSIRALQVLSSSQRLVHGSGHATVHWHRTVVLQTALPGVEPESVNC